MSNTNPAANEKSSADTPESQHPFLREYLSRPAPTTGMGRFGEGFQSPWAGAKFLRQNPSLLVYTIAPFFINLVATAAAAVLLFMAGSYVFYQLWPVIVGESAGIWWWLWAAVALLVGLLILGFIAICVMILWKLFTGIFCGYFYGKLAEKTEQMLGLDEDEIQSIPFVYEAVDTVVNVFALTLVNLLGFVPLVGSIAGFICSFVLLGLDQLGYPLALRGRRRYLQFEYARANFYETTGLGAAVFICEFIPILGAVLLVAGVVGAVLLYRRIESYRPK